jgi:hypothetical protein
MTSPPRQSVSEPMALSAGPLPIAVIPALPPGVGPVRWFRHQRHVTALNLPFMRGKQITTILGATALLVAGCGSTKSAETSTGVTIGGTSITITKLNPSSERSAMTTSVAAPTSSSPTQPATTASSSLPTGDDAYAASIKQSILDGAAVESTSQACAEGIEWICVITDVKTSTKGVAIVTVQVTGDDKQYGEKVARYVYNFASASHPELRSVQVNNAEGKVLANETFS